MVLTLNFRQGNEHTFKDIRRKVSSQSSFSQDKDSVKSKSEMDKMMQSIEDLKNRQAEFEKALEQKEAEKMMIYQVCSSTNKASSKAQKVHSLIRPFVSRK